MAHVVPNLGWHLVGPVATVERSCSIVRGSDSTGWAASASTKKVTANLGHNNTCLWGEGFEHQVWAIACEDESRACWSSEVTHLPSNSKHSLSLSKPHRTSAPTRPPNDQNPKGRGVDEDEKFYLTVSLTEYGLAIVVLTRTSAGREINYPNHVAWCRNAIIIIIPKIVSHSI